MALTFPDGFFEMYNYEAIDTIKQQHFYLRSESSCHLVYFNTM